MASKSLARAAAAAAAARATTTVSRPVLTCDAARAMNARPAPATIREPDPGEAPPIGMSGRIPGSMCWLPSDEDGESVTDELDLHLGAILNELAVEVDPERRTGGGAFHPPPVVEAH